tara:strand:- start:8989 stop:9099 length:111 start_codon:yes stop_codon:yes gene_type:complete
MTDRSNPEGAVNNMPAPEALSPLGLALNGCAPRIAL